jgi:hypothetical protein
MSRQPEIREAVAKSLREFGYPGATAKNITEVWLFGQSAKSQLEDARDHPALQADCDALLAEIAAIPEPTK